LKTKSQWFPLVLSLTVFPGLGQFYLGQKGKGFLFGILTAVILMAGLARFMSVMFALANVRPTSEDPVSRAVTLLGETWRLDFPILLAFLGALAMVWGLAALDCWLTLREQARPS